MLFENGRKCGVYAIFVPQSLSKAGHERRCSRAFALHLVHPNPPVFPLVTPRSEEHTSELQSLMRISYAVFCLKKKNTHHRNLKTTQAPTHTPQTPTTKRSQTLNTRTTQKHYPDHNT